MGKLLSWIFLIALVYAVMRLVVLFKRKSSALARQRAARSGTAQPGGAPPAPGGQRTAAPDEGGERMIACAHCGVYAPASDMLAARGRFYCSAAHRDADAS